MPHILYLALLWGVAAVSLPTRSQSKNSPSCRFALEYSQNDILRDSTSFVNDYLYWEGKFHQNDIAYNTENGVSYDGSQLDWTTGKATIKHNFSAASKEVSPTTQTTRQSL